MEMNRKLRGKHRLGGCRYKSVRSSNREGRAVRKTGGFASTRAAAHR